MTERLGRKVQLALTGEALGIIESNAPSERKRGEWVSAALADYARITAGISPLGDDDDGLLERIDSRLARLEKQVGFIASSIAR